MTLQESIIAYRGIPSQIGTVMAMALENDEKRREKRLAIKRHQAYLKYLRDNPNARKEEQLKSLSS